MDNAEEHVLTSSHDLDDYDVLSTNTLSVAVPYRSTESLRKLIWAAMVTYVFGNSSVDHVIRRYGHLWEHRANKSFETAPCLLILRATYEDVAQIANKLETVVTSRLEHLCAKSALCRLEATFKAAYGLIRRDYIFETEAVVRMLLEQLSWAYVAHSSDETKLRTLNPTKCITPFKSVFPEAGNFYGALSEGAHLDPSIVENYLKFHELGSSVIRRSAPDSQYCGYYLTALASVYLKVIQKLFSPFNVKEYNSIEQRLIKRHRDYCKLLNDEPIDAKL
jgi:hypothetical protein